MMKTIFRHLFLAAVALAGSALAVQAEPAAPGMWRTIKLADGRQVRAELRGDEFAHFFADADGKLYRPAKDGDIYRELTPGEIGLIHQEASARREVANRQQTARLAQARKAARAGKTSGAYTGTKKGIIILVQFQDTKFQLSHGTTYFNNIINGRNYTSSLGYVGSVRDYFLAQSNGQFELDFDIVGPITLDHECAYYGGNDSGGNDLRAGSMVTEAVRKADPSVNYADYDWDGDGYADQVFVLFAGLGEASGGAPETIWPHKHQLQYSNVGSSYISQDNGVVVDVYACGSEQRMKNTALGPREAVAGIGTICHEFSHCLGLPDVYDTRYTGNYGMGSFDIMSSGNHNQNGMCPPNYSAYEKWTAGWLEPVVLDKAATVKGVRPQAVAYGETYIIYNDAHADEFYLLENRQNNVGVWDKSIAGSGLMIMHVDYSEIIWRLNNVNSNVNYSDQYGPAYADWDNDHERCTIFHADNDVKNEAADLYPYNGNNSLTDTSVPAAKLYNGASTMGKPITNITQNADGTIDFDFMGGSSDNIITAIESIGVDAGSKTNKVYSIEGCYMGDTLEGLPHGIYIVNGKKVVR